MSILVVRVVRMMESVRGVDTAGNMFGVILAGGGVHRVQIHRYWNIHKHYDTLVTRHSSQFLFLLNDINTPNFNMLQIIHFQVFEQLIRNMSCNSSKIIRGHFSATKKLFRGDHGFLIQGSIINLWNCFITPRLINSGNIVLCCISGGGSWISDIEMNT